MFDLFGKKTKAVEEKTVCPICGSDVVDGFCNVCKKYISDEITHEKLSAKYPGTKCPNCKSKRIQFGTDNIKEALPRNFIDKFALNLITKHDSKYPREIPDFRETAKCQKCGHTWFVDNFKDNNDRMKTVSSCMVGIIIILLFVMVIIVGSIFDSDSDTTDNSPLDSSAAISESSTMLVSEIDTSLTQESSVEDSTLEEFVEDTENETEEDIIEEVIEEDTEEETKEPSTNAKSGITVYVTPSGKKYHYSASCAGKNAIEEDLDDVQGTFEPCKKCS